MAIALIPARTGSKGIPGKNFLSLDGVSPVSRAINVCVAAGVQPWVSCDAPNPDKWPFWIERPADLAADDTPMRAVVGHFLAMVPGDENDIILLVQPTQPLRTPNMLRAAVALVEQHGSCVSITPTESISKLYYQGLDSLIPVGIPTERRQDGRPTFRCDGTVYGFRRRDGYFNLRTAKPLLIDPSDTVPLDTPLDWQIAELRLHYAHATRTSPSLQSSPK